MLHYINKMPSFNQVSAGKTSSVMLPSGLGGPTYRAIILKATDDGSPATSAEIIETCKRVRVKINGTPRIDVSGKYIRDVLMKYYGIAFVDGQLTIPLTRPWMKTIEGEENLGWGSRNIRTLEVSVEVGAGATAPTLEAFAAVTAQERDLGAIIEIHEFNFATAVSGSFEISTLPRGNGDLVALHFDNADVNKAEVFLNKVPFADSDKDIVHELYKWTGERSPQTGYAHIDALYNNRLGDVWPIRNVGDFRVILDMADAGGVPIVMETLNTPLPASMA